MLFLIRGINMLKGKIFSFKKSFPFQKFQIRLTVSEVDRIAPGSAALGVGDAPAGVASGGEVGGQVVFG